MDKIISQMTKEEKLQALADYHACKRERHIILRYIQHSAGKMRNRPPISRASAKACIKLC